MVKKRKKGLGLLHGLWRMGKAFAKGFDQSAEFVAKHTGNPKSTRIRRASLEWTERGNGERLPATPIGMRWQSKHTAKDKEIWRASFSPGGMVHEFVTWPPRDYLDAQKKALESVSDVYGVFAKSWSVIHVEKVADLHPATEETEDIKA